MASVSNRDEAQSPGAVLDSLVSDAVLRGVPRQLAEEARSCTARVLSWNRTSAVSFNDSRRARAYFWGVVRRSSARSRGDGLRRLRTRYVVLTLAEDMLAAGRSGPEVIDELAREYGDVENLDALVGRLAS